MCSVVDYLALWKLFFILSENKCHQMAFPGEKQALISLNIQPKFKNLDRKQRQNTTTTVSTNNNVIHWKQTSCPVH